VIYQSVQEVGAFETFKLLKTINMGTSSSQLYKAQQAIVDDHNKHRGQMIAVLAVAGCVDYTAS